MNKILIDKKVIYDGDNVKIDGNTIEFLEDGLYEIEYLNSGDYHLKFIINGKVDLLISSFDNDLKINNQYVVNRGKLTIYKFYNNHNVDEIVNIDLCNAGSEVDYKFANICREIEKYEININHIANKTYSNINNKTVSLKNSKVNFVINSSVLKEAVDSKLSQNTRIVTMGDCEASICPNMFTPLDMVEAKHGSIIGTFKDEDIFYLMSKGISYNDSLKLMIKGYLLSNIDINHEIRKRIMDIIDVYWG